MNRNQEIPEYKSPTIPCIYILITPSEQAKYDIQCESFLEQYFQSRSIAEYKFVSPNNIPPDVNCVICWDIKGLKYLLPEVFQNIISNRGSVYRSNLAHAKIIPCYNPLNFYRHYAKNKMWPLYQIEILNYDISKWDKENQFPDLYETPRKINLLNSNYDLDQYLEENSDKKYLSLDIETLITVPSHIGLAFEPYVGANLQVKNMTRHQWRKIANLLNNHKTCKIMHNGRAFDQKLLLASPGLDPLVYTGLSIKNFVYDTKLMFSILCPELPATLGFLTSILTDKSFYKNQWKTDMRAYNATDAMITFEVWEKIKSSMTNKNMLEFYYLMVEHLFPFYNLLENRGFLRDTSIIEQLKLNTSQNIQDHLNEANNIIKKFLVGNNNNNNNIEFPNPNSNSTDGQVHNFVYKTLGFPERGSVDEDTLSDLLRNSKEPGYKKRLLDIILAIRKLIKFKSTYLKSELFPGNISRTVYDLYVDTARSSTSPWDVLCPEPKGLAFQTIVKRGKQQISGIPRTVQILDFGEFKKSFVARPGYTLLEMDLSQAEARVVASLAEDKNLKKMFHYKVDVHRITAAWVFGRSIPNLENFFKLEPEYITPEFLKLLSQELKSKTSDNERYLGKTFRHAAHLGVGYRMASLSAGVSQQYAKFVLSRLHEVSPNIKKVFHAGVEQFLQDNNNCLYNIYGIHRMFLGGSDSQAMKKAYSYIPQSTVALTCKFRGAEIVETEPIGRIYPLVENHDSLTFEILNEPSEIEYFAKKLKTVLERPIDLSPTRLSNDKIIIPVEITIGTNWYDREEIKCG